MPIASIVNDGGGSIVKRKGLAGKADLIKY